MKLQRLDADIIELRKYTFAESTKKSYASHLKCYDNFCKSHNLNNYPATSQTLCRFIAFLARDRAFSTIQQSLSAIRLAHLERGLPHPYQDNHQISSLLTGVKRVKGVSPSYKLTVSISQFRELQTKIYSLSLPDTQLLCVMNCCFYGLLRIGNVTTPQVNKWDPEQVLTRQDITVTATGAILNIRSSKTIQFKQRVFQAVIPRLPGNPQCPTATLEYFFNQVGPLPDHYPALAYKRLDSSLILPHTPTIRKRLICLFGKLGLSPKEYNTHSLRRSGATHLLSAGVPVAMIKIMGDWKSDAIFKYLKPSPQTKLDVAKSFTS